MVKNCQKNPIIITFDDGYEDNYTNMMPMINAMGMKATMFMATNYIGKENYVSWQQFERKCRIIILKLAVIQQNHLPLTEVENLDK